MRTATPAQPTALPPSSDTELSGSCADLSGSTADRLVLVVAPTNGRFLAGGASGPVAAGAVVGQITSRRAAVDVCAPAAIVVEGLLAVPGRLVTQGQALAWGTLAEHGPMR